MTQVIVITGASEGIGAEMARQWAQRGGAGVALGKVVLCDSDVTKGPEDDRALAARGGVEEVTELMVPADTKMMRRLTALSFHRPPMYLPECIARDLLRVRKHARPPYTHRYRKLIKAYRCRCQSLVQIVKCMYCLH